MAGFDVNFAGTLRQAAKAGADISNAPERATHVSRWTTPQGAVALVWERKSFGRVMTWDGVAWTTTESHYIAGRLLRGQHGPGECCAHQQPSVALAPDRGDAAAPQTNAAA